MQIIQDEVRCRGVKFYVQGDGGEEIARAFLYIMFNDLHRQPFGLVEDVFVSEEEGIRGRGVGTALVKKVIETARMENCYKLIATSRYSRDKIHRWYGRLGFKDYGKEFWMEISK